MSVLTTRGGVPRIQRVAVDAAGRRYVPAGAQTDPAVGRYTFWTEHMQVFNVGAGEARLYFLETDFDNDVNYIAIPADGLWEGPAELKEFWMRSASGTTVQIVSFQRRG